MWHLTELDIQSTLEKVCFKVTHDHSVTQPVLDLRKKTLLILGEVYAACGVSAEIGLEDLRYKLTQQMNAAQAAQSQAHEASEAAAAAGTASASGPTVADLEMEEVHPAEPVHAPVATAPMSTSEKELD